MAVLDQASLLFRFVKLANVLGYEELSQAPEHELNREEVDGVAAVLFPEFTIP